MGDETHSDRDDDGPPGAVQPLVTRDPAAFADSIVFDKHRDMFALWRDAAEGGGRPLLSDLQARLDEGMLDYLMVWHMVDDGRDIEVEHLGRHLADFSGITQKESRLSAMHQGPRGAALLEMHIDCMVRGTPFVVVRSIHPFGDDCCGYESLTLPVTDADGAPLMLGHVEPFAPASIAATLCPPELLDRGLRLERE